MLFQSMKMGTKSLYQLGSFTSETGTRRMIGLRLSVQILIYLKLRGFALKNIMSIFFVMYMFLTYEKLIDEDKCTIGELVFLI